jgi:hypothetical protein
VPHQVTLGLCLTGSVGVDDPKQEAYLQKLREDLEDACRVGVCVLAVHRILHVIDHARSQLSERGALGTCTRTRRDRTPAHVEGGGEVGNGLKAEHTLVQTELTERGAQEEGDRPAEETPGRAGEEMGACLDPSGMYRIDALTDWMVLLKGLL